MVLKEGVLEKKTCLRTSRTNRVKTQKLFKRAEIRFEMSAHHQVIPNGLANPPPPPLLKGNIV